MKEFKNYQFELKDIDTRKGEILVKHATFGNIDRVNDEIQPGAFSNHYRNINPKSVGFYLNHYDDQVLGETKKVYEDNTGAYTLAQFSKDGLGQGVLEMALNKCLSGVSMGYYPEEKAFTSKNGKRVRLLKKILHGETSLLTKLPANPEAGIVEIKSYADRLENFCRTSKKAPDKLLRQLETEVKAMKQAISYDDYMDELELLELRVSKEKKELQQMKVRALLLQIKQSL